MRWWELEIAQLLTFYRVYQAYYEITVKIIIVFYQLLQVLLFRAHLGSM